MRLRRRMRRLKLRLQPGTAEQKDARRKVSVWNAIQRGNDPDLIRMRDEHDMLEMNYHMTKEAHAEWGAIARRIAPKPPERACDCDLCAISRALAKCDPGPTT